MLSGTNIDEEFEKITEGNYDEENGPLWKIRIQRNTELPCLIPDLESEYSNHYDLLFGFHHASTDGYSNVRICKLLIEIFNDVISEKIIDDTQLGCFSSGEKTEKLVELREQELKNDPEILEQIKKKNKIIESAKVIWTSIKNGEMTCQPRTIHTHRTMNFEETNNLLKKFKSEKLTFNSGFFFIVCSVFVDILNEKRQDSTYDIGLGHFVNVRRYWNNTDELQLGVHLGCLPMVVTVKKDVKDDIWTYAREYHSQFNKILRSNKIFDSKFYENQTANDGINPSLEEVCKNVDTITPSSYFLTTNMGDITSLLGTEGEHVQSTWLARSTSFQDFPVMMVFSPHTYRGRFHFGLTYNTRYVSFKSAEEILDRVLDLCLSLS